MKKTLILIIGLGFILRLLFLNQSFWLDESIGAIVVKNQSFFQILTEFVKHDNHPPLYYLTLKLWSDLFGYSEVALRALSVLFGLGTIALVYKIGKVFDKRGGTVAAILIATSQFHIYYSQEARMYSMAAFLAALSFYLFIKEKWIFFSLTITALVFTDYMPVFLLPVFWMAGILCKHSKKWWKNLIVSQVPLVLLGVFWLPTFLIQSRGGAWLLETLPAWAKVAGGATAKQALLVWSKFVFGRISLDAKGIYYFLVFTFSLPFFFALLKAWSKRKEVAGLWLYLLTPLLVGFVASIFFPAFIYFRFMYVVPAFFLLTAWGLTRFSKKVFLVLFVTIIIGNITSYLIYSFDASQQREEWRGAVSFVETQAQPTELVVFNFTEPFAPYQWYSKGKVGAIGLTDSISANEVPTKEKTLKTVRGVKGVYYFEYLWELHDPGRVVASTLEGEGFIEVGAFDYPGVGIIRYLKKL